MLGHVRTLSDDSMEGRRAGSAGGQAAIGYLVQQMYDNGITPACGIDLQQAFSFGAEPIVNGVNLIGSVPGTSESALTIVVSAHFDHLGTRAGAVFNGADDNASGTAVMLEMGRYFSQNPPRHTIIFAGFDAEELGLQGARAFVDSRCRSNYDVALNINLDMVSRSEAGELYASGPLHYPELRPIIEQVPQKEGFQLLFGHDEPGTGSDDWTFSSDHAPFHQAGIPYIYFGVEDHPGYHNPDDTFDAITPEFFYQAGEFVLEVTKQMDASLEVLYSNYE